MLCGPKVHELKYSMNWQAHMLAKMDLVCYADTDIVADIAGMPFHKVGWSGVIIRAGSRSIKFVRWWAGVFPWPSRRSLHWNLSSPERHFDPLAGLGPCHF